MGKKKTKNKHQQQQVKPKVATTPSISKVVDVCKNVNMHPECTHNKHEHCRLGTTCSAKTCKAFHR